MPHGRSLIPTATLVSLCQSQEALRLRTCSRPFCTGRIYDCLALSRENNRWALTLRSATCVYMCHTCKFQKDTLDRICMWWRCRHFTCRVFYPSFRVSDAIGQATRNVPLLEAVKHAGCLTKACLKTEEQEGAAPEQESVTSPAMPVTASTAGAPVGSPKGLQQRHDRWPGGHQAKPRCAGKNN